MKYIPLDRLPSLERRLAWLVDHGSRAETRDALAMLLGLHGLRVSEVCRVLAENLDVDAGTLEPPLLKRGARRTVPLARGVVAALVRWRADSQVPWLLFTRSGRQLSPTYLRRRATRITAATIGKAYRFHALRHTFAIRVYASTKDILLVKRLLGHRSLQSTLVYADSLAEVPAAALPCLSTAPIAAVVPT